MKWHEMKLSAISMSCLEGVLIWDFTQLMGYRIEGSHAM